MKLLTFCVRRKTVKGAVTQHGKQHVAAASCVRNEGLVVSLFLSDFTGLMGPGGRIVQSGEGGQEHRVFELLVTMSRRQRESCRA